MNKNDPQFYVGDFKAPEPRGRSLSLEDTSEFTRPTWATPQDLPVGQDELGNTVFQGIGGKTYIAKPNPLYGQQRPEGGFARAALDAIPPVNEWSVSGMGEAAVRGAKAIGEILWDAVDTPRATLAGEKTPTIGDAVDVAGMAGLGGVGLSRTLGVPDDALGMFVGPRSSKADLNALDRAIDMKDSGNYSAQEIAIDTGWREFNGNWMFEVDDSAFRINPNLRGAVNKSGDALGSTLDKSVLGTKALGHYPVVDATKFYLGGYSPNFLPKGVSGGFLPRVDTNVPGTIKTHVHAPENVALHEIQHAIQQQEGWSGGFSQSKAFHDFAATFDNMPREAKQYLGRRSMLENAKQDLQPGVIENLFPEYTPTQANKMRSDTEKYINQLEQELDNISENLGPLADSLEELYSITGTGRATNQGSYDMYLRNEGEWLARKTQERANLSAQERYLKDPFENVPDNLWNERQWKGLMNKIDDQIRNFSGSPSLYSHMEDTTKQALGELK